MQSPLDNLSGFSVLLFAAGLRLSELVISGRNQKNMSAHGFSRRDAGVSYTVMVIMHVSFFPCCIAEYIYLGKPLGPLLTTSALLLFLAAQIIRFWAIGSLGRYWNTNVMTADKQAGFVSSGPYQFIRHPNYLAVILEFFSIPLLLGAWRTAIIYTIWNAIVLRYRISLEEKQLVQISGYTEIMQKKARFIPGVF